MRYKRLKLGIPAPELRRWTPEELALLGKLPDEQVARRINRPSGLRAQGQGEAAVA